MKRGRKEAGKGREEREKEIEGKPRQEREEERRMVSKLQLINVIGYVSKNGKR